MKLENIISAAVVALVASLLVCWVKLSDLPVSVPQPEAAAEAVTVGSLSFPLHNTPEVFLGGVGAGVSPSYNNFLNFTIDGVIPAGSNQGFWTNKTGRTVFISDAEVYLPTGSASSSMRVSIGTSTATSITNNYAAPFATLIDNQLLATTTSQTVALNSLENPGTNGVEVIPVPNGTTVNIIFRQDNPNACTGSVCEAATSTARGFSTVQWFAKGHYKP